MRDNYTVHLRHDIFDPFVTELILVWDIPHGAAPASDLCMPPETIEALRTKFYEHIGRVFDCDMVSTWLSEARSTAIPSHPSAFK